MSKDPRDAFDRGFRDGVRERNDKRDVVSKVIGDFIDSPYKGDKDHPNSYREGFNRGRKNG